MTITLYAPHGKKGPMGQSYVEIHPIDKYPWLKEGFTEDPPILSREEVLEQGPLDINMATVMELEALNGIGPKRAAAIVEELNNNGSFADIQDAEERLPYGWQQWADEIRFV